MGCGLLYLLVGEPKEAAVLLGFVLVVMGITLYQERKTERALEALRDLSSPRALVIRGGERVRIPGREVVRGDWVVLVEGDRVPADALLLDASHLVVDESLLTGESVPVRKAAGTETAEMARTSASSPRSRSVRSAPMQAAAVREPPPESASPTCPDPGRTWAHSAAL